MLIPKLPKGAEFTYGVHARSLAGMVDDNCATILHPTKATQILRDLDAAVMGSVRKLNEQFELLRQGIAYVLPFTRNEAGKLVFLVYCRKKINNEGQLALKLSLAPGGHIEREDLDYHVVRADGKDTQTPAIDWLGTLGSNLRRELCEEVAFTPPGYMDAAKNDIGVTGHCLGSVAASHAQPVGFVMDSKVETGYVGNIHFGALYVAPLPEGTTFKMAEKHNEAVGWFSADDLHKVVVEQGLEMADGVAPFEPWSQMIIEQIDKVEYVINGLWGREPRASIQDQLCDAVKQQQHKGE